MEEGGRGEDEVVCVVVGSWKIARVGAPNVQIPQNNTSRIKNSFKRLQSAQRNGVYGGGWREDEHRGGSSSLHRDLHSRTPQGRHL